MGQRHSLNNTVKRVSLSHETVRSARTIALKEGMPNTQRRTDCDRRVCLTAWQPYDCSSSKAIGNEVEESSEDAMLLKFFLTHEEPRAMTHRGRVNHLVQAKCENRNPKSFFQNDYHTHQSFSLRGTHELYLNAVQTQHRGRPGI